jgi:hypothetical protein
MSDSEFDKAAFVLLCGDEDPLAEVICAEMFPNTMHSTYILERIRWLLLARNQSAAVLCNVV